MDPVLLRQRLETARRTFETLERQLADPAVAADPARLQAIARERSRLEPLVHDFDQLQRLELERDATRRLLKDQRLEPDGADFAALA
ncbi:MAG: PCRF domain-containing protein, partial [Cyanobium sp.]